MVKKKSFCTMDSNLQLFDSSAATLLWVALISWVLSSLLCLRTAEHVAALTGWLFSLKPQQTVTLTSTLVSWSVCLWVCCVLLHVCFFVLVSLLFVALWPLYLWCHILQSQLHHKNVFCKWSIPGPWSTNQILHTHVLQGILTDLLTLEPCPYFKNCRRWTGAKFN